MNFYKRHLGDFAKHTAHLSALEVGVYDLLLDFAYVSEEPLPLDQKRLYSIARVTNLQTRNAIQVILSQFFVKTKSGYVNKRVQEELDAANAKRSAAQRAAQARWNASKRKADAMPNAMRTDSETHSGRNASQTPDSRLQNKTKGTKQSSRKQRARAYTREAESLAALLRDRGVSDASPTHPAVLRWASESAFTDAIRDEALRRFANRGGPMHAPCSYLVPIVDDVLAEAAAAKVRPMPSVDAGSMPRVNGKPEFYRDRLARTAHRLTTVSDDDRTIEAETKEIGHAKPA
ncbi:YdaU family protein [Caballeronia sp. ATUFL_F1_KS39]|uniref:YdaU family protein n=1 Tax=Caballeronia sp. ATUFL_F1_KS39 TaxID=2921766 RepID=UPI002028925C|nr:YdaU family protein [Caballeronia sp. ATUFL_F1_KS39]